MIRELKNDVIREKAEKVEDVNEETRILLNDMVETMIKNEGVGLAAPQIGISLRIIVVGYEGKIYKMINPEITDITGIQFFQEGCLSVPNKSGLVKRYERVKISYLDENGKPMKIQVQKFLAQIFQHEIDHLDGILFIDKMVK